MQHLIVLILVGNLNLLHATEMAPSCMNRDPGRPVFSPAANAVHETALSQDDYSGRALRLYQRLTGVPLRLKDKRVNQIADLIRAGHIKDAAHIATEDDYFYNLTIRNMAAEMSAKAENALAPLNDFQAMMIGAVRDNLDARELLTGDFRYEGDRSLGLSDVTDQDNEHYIELENNGINLRQNLVKVSPQRPYGLTPGGFALDSPPAAGLLTSRGWAVAHFNAGTNRRALEYTFREFLCAPLTQWKQWGIPDFRVRRDVPRSPGGVPATYQNQCRECHANMDAMAGAFARLDFQDEALVFYQAPDLAPKYNINIDHYPDGYVTTDESWINMATTGVDAGFGWRGVTTGNGVHEFATMIANSRGFSQCMALRAFQKVCLRGPRPDEMTALNTIIDGFESGGYKLRDLFEQVATLPACFDPQNNRGGA